MPDRPIERWRDRPLGGKSLEDIAAERFREVQMPVIDEAQLARVAQRIAASEQKGPRISARRLQWAVFAVLFGTFTAGATLVGVEIVRAVRLAKTHRPATPAPGYPPKQQAAAEARQPPVVEPMPPEEPAEVLFGEASAIAAPGHVAQKRGLRDGALTGEARLLHDALEELNIRGAPESALAHLDLYRERYPNGLLTREANVARVDALLRLGRYDAALVLLNRAAADGFAGYPRPANLRVLRGELLAKSGRCREALAVFTEALGDPLAGQSVERALYGRAACRATQGDTQGSRGDLARYLELYPQGHFVREANRALGR